MFTTGGEEKIREQRHTHEMLWVTLQYVRYHKLSTIATAAYVDVTCVYSEQEGSGTNS